MPLEILSLMKQEYIDFKEINTCFIKMEIKVRRVKGNTQPKPTIPFDVKTILDFFPNSKPSPYFQQTEIFCAHRRHKDKPP